MTYNERKVPWEKLPDDLKIRFAKKVSQYLALKQKLDAVRDQLARAMHQDEYELKGILENYLYEDAPNPAEIYEEMR